MNAQESIETHKNTHEYFSILNETLLNIIKILYPKNNKDKNTIISVFYSKVLLT